MGYKTFDVLKGNKAPSLLPHQCGLNVSDGCSAVQEAHNLKQGKTHGLSLFHQTEGVPDEDKLLALMLDRKELEIASDAWETHVLCFSVSG